MMPRRTIGGTPSGSRNATGATPLRIGLPTGLALLALAFAAACGPQPGPARPNIVLIVADDLGWADAGFRGGEGSTPALDRLAAAGIVLDRFYAAPICTPTRTQLMTGRSAMRFDLIGNLVPADVGGLPPDQKLLPQRLAESADYRTALVGKWHLGTARGFRPHERGFEHAYGLLEGWVDHFSHKRNGTLDWWRNGEPVSEPGYTADLIADEAIGWLRRIGSERPFFLYLPFPQPHTPLQAPARLIAEAPRAVPAERRTYLAMVTALDRSIGRVIEEIDRRGQLADTLVVFMSDNGGAIHFGGSNRPLRAGKRTTFEGGIRVPALISWPARLPQGTTSGQFATSLDVVPTLLEAAGVEIDDALDGRSLLGPLADETTLSREAQFFASEAPAKLFLAVLAPPWKLVVVFDRTSGQAATQLFDVVADPEEHRDVAAEHPDLVDALTVRLREWWALNPRRPAWPPAPPPGAPRRLSAGPEQR